MNKGLRTLSSWLTIAAPQIHTPIAAPVSPCNNNNSPAAPQAKGVPNGISANIIVKTLNITGELKPATQYPSPATTPCTKAVSKMPYTTARVVEPAACK